MAYVKVYKKWLPYGLMWDKRGFVSLRFGDGHTGVDSVGNQMRNPVCAIIGGRVLEAYTSSSLGNVVKYGDGNVVIAYYHLASINVKVGQMVVANKTKIGYEGSTGSICRGKHLHTSIWIDGVLVDPEPYLSGEQKLIVTKAKERKYMIRKVIKSLNLRESASLIAKKVYSDMPVDTIVLVTETKVAAGITWGKLFTVINGKSYTGWANLGETWSVEV
jgi:hypothetical protein